MICSTFFGITLHHVGAAMDGKVDTTLEAMLESLIDAVLRAFGAPEPVRANAIGAVLSRDPAGWWDDDAST